MLSLYLDGRRDVVRNVPDLNGCEYCEMRFGGAAGGRGFVGLVDEVTFYSRALGTDVIPSEYRLDLRPKEPGI